MLSTSFARITLATRFAADRSRTSRAWSPSPIVRQRPYESSWDYKPCGLRLGHHVASGTASTTNPQWTVAGARQDRTVTTSAATMGIRERSRTPGWIGAFAGLIGAAVALGLSELIAGLFAPGSSLITAVGQTVIDLQPPGGK